MEGHKVMTITPNLDEKMEVINFIETKMKEGKANSKIRGWAMSTIIEQVKESFGDKHTHLARDYFMRYFDKTRPNKKGQ